MKIGILTFHFAYNYGAMLQTYALKTYFQKLGHEVRVLPYFPAHFMAQYSISPFVKDISIKRRIRNFLYYFRKVPQVKCFEQFKKERIYGDKGGNVEEVCDIKKLQKYCDDLDLIVYGSDQIWNDRITREDSIYFGAELNAVKISYAASMGTQDVSQTQIEYIKSFLPQFKSLSVREPAAKSVIEGNIDKVVAVVCDPVFLLEKTDWEKIEEEIKIDAPYMLLYMLENDVKLLNIAKSYAEEKGLKIYEVHPTLELKQKGTRLLKKVGPKEFLFLVRHAEYVCTNSFHAVSFSVIHRKKLIHIPNSKSPERTVTLLNKMGIESSHDGVYIEDLSEYLYNNLEDFTETSKTFLKELMQE